MTAIRTQLPDLLSPDVRQHDQDGEKRDRKDQVHESHEDAVDPAPEEAGERADRHPDDRRKHGDQKRGLDVLLDAPEHLGEQVVTDAVDTEGVLRRSVRR